MADTLEIFGLEYQNVTGFKATDDNGNTLTYIRPSGTKQISANGTGIDVEGYAAVDVAVPTGTARSSSDLMASNLTVTAPAGLYAEAASKTLSDANLVAGNIKKDISIFGVTGTYEGSGGSSNSPIVNSTLSFASSVNTFQVTLPKTVTNAVVQVEATASTISAMEASTSTVYHFISGVFFFPTGSVTIGSKTGGKYGAFERYRPSATTFYAQHNASVSVSGTTLTLTLDSATRFTTGTDTYTVKVWEVATS